VEMKSDADFEPEFERGLLGGVVVLRQDGQVAAEADRGGSDADGALYGRYQADAPRLRSVRLTSIPYYAWANRDSCHMEVWTPVAKA